MDKDDFAPGGRVPPVRALATVNIRRDELAILASELTAGHAPPDEGARRDARPATAGEVPPLWGLVYAREDAIGFYAHPSTSELSALFDRGRIGSREIDLCIPVDCLVSARFDGRPDGVPTAKTPVARLMRLIAGETPRVLRLEWKAAGEPRSLAFRVERGATELDSFIAGHFARER